MIAIADQAGSIGADAMRKEVAVILSLRFIRAFPTNEIAGGDFSSNVEEEMRHRSVTRINFDGSLFGLVRER